MLGLSLPNTIDVVVVSYGGVGTTLLMKHLARFRKLNDPDDTDGWKHLTVPPVTRRRDVRFIYVFGDPVDAAVSLFRRDYQRWQSMKLQRFHPHPPGPIAPSVSLAEYASLGVDRFQFERHFDNWSARYLVRPTLFLRYEKMWEQLDQVAEFLALPPGAFDDFPPQRPRQASVQQIDETTRAQLNAMYGALSARLAQWPDASVRGASGAPFSRYLRAYPPLLLRDLFTDPTGRVRQRLRGRFPRLAGWLFGLARVARGRRPG